MCWKDCGYSFNHVLTWHHWVIILAKLMSFLYKGKPHGTTWNRHCCNFAGTKEGKNSNPKKPLLTACLHPATKGKPEISEQVLIKAVSSQSNRQYRGDRLPGLRAAWLGLCAWRCKTPLFLVKPHCSFGTEVAGAQHCLIAAGFLHLHQMGREAVSNVEIQI